MSLNANLHPVVARRTRSPAPDNNEADSVKSQLEKLGTMCDDQARGVEGRDLSKFISTLQSDQNENCAQVNRWCHGMLDKQVRRGA